MRREAMARAVAGGRARPVDDETTAAPSDMLTSMTRPHQAVPLKRPLTALPAQGDTARRLLLGAVSS